MANLRCTHCGRFIDDPHDHAPDCPMYGKETAYMREPDETKTEPDVRANEPTVEMPAVPGVERKAEPPDEVIDVSKVGLEATGQVLEREGGMVVEREDSHLLLHMYGRVFRVHSDDILTRDPSGTWYATDRSLWGPRS
jgi:hypothetical protein